MRAMGVEIGGGKEGAKDQSAASPLLRLPLAFVRQHGPQLGWALLSIGFFAGVWEFLWYIGAADPRLLPPPHVFLGDFAGQAKNFNTAKRWQIGVDPNSGPTPAMAGVITMASPTIGVPAGLPVP